MYSTSFATCRRHPALRSEPELLVHQDRRDTAGSDRLVNNQEVIYSAGNAVGLPGPQVLKRKAVLVDASQSGVEIGDDLLTKTAMRRVLQDRAHQECGGAECIEREPLS
jgi:hypothetical protein